MQLDTPTLIGLFRELSSDAYIQIFVWSIFIDIITGVTKSVANKKLSSNIGILGLLKYITIISITMLAYPYFQILGFKPVGITFLVFFICAQLLSIQENLKAVNIDIPKFVTDLIIKTKNAADDGGNENEN